MNGITGADSQKSSMDCRRFQGWISTYKGLQVIKMMRGEKEWKISWLYPYMVMIYQRWLYHSWLSDFKLVYSFCGRSFSLHDSPRLWEYRIEMKKKLFWGVETFWRREQHEKHSGIEWREMDNVMECVCIRINNNMGKFKSCVMRDVEEVRFLEINVGE